MKLPFLCMVSIFILNLSAYSQHKDSVYIGMKDGTTIQGRKIIYKAPLFSTSYLLLNDSSKIPASIVKYYQDKSGYYLNATTRKVAREEFYKRTVAGKISLYSKTYISNSYNPNFGSPGPNNRIMYTQSRRVVELMQKEGSAELLPLTYKNLYKLTSDNEECLPYLKKIKGLSQVSTFTYIAASALFIAGGLQMISTNNANTGTGNNRVSYNPLMIAGTGLGFLPWIFNSSKRDKIKKTLDIYNSY